MVEKVEAAIQAKNTSTSSDAEVLAKFVSFDNLKLTFAGLVYLATLKGKTI
jgi:hypothetical protein